MPDLKAAARLIEDGAITKVQHPHIYLVQSQSSDRIYRVTLGEDIAPHCDCPAYERGGYGRCKHVLACLTLDKPAVAAHCQRMAAQAAGGNHA